MSGFEANRTSGSSAVALQFLESFAGWLAADMSTDAPALRRQMLDWLRAAQAAQPTLGLIHQLAARALLVADTSLARGDRAAATRASLEASCRTEAADLAQVQTAVAAQARALVTERGGWIATLSTSGAVREGLLAVRDAGLAPRALIGEGRPLLEGRALAADLAAAGIPVWLVVDAALPLLLSQAAMVWLGADAVTDSGVVNKIGSFGVALAAREHSVPVYALASRRKFLPAATAALRIEERPPEEVWSEAPEAVEPRNVYFELVPLHLCRGIVVEDGVLAPGEAAQLARERELPAELAGLA